VWRQTVLLYTAQLNTRLLDQVIRQACELGSEAAALAVVYLKEYPHFEKLGPDMVALFHTLNALAQDSKYRQLETYLKAQLWRKIQQTLL